MPDEECKGTYLLCFDDQSFESLFGSRRWDDQTEPNREDNTEGDGGSCQPAWDSYLGMQTGDPVRPFAAKLQYMQTKIWNAVKECLALNYRQISKPKSSYIP